ncbi:hypothetical protein [Streptomyces sp. NPDC056479]|uniref:hypothetical protein n=1 Tax=unclassified Streptomyces TaxID=2593676 RepID=UPI0036943A50
MSLAPLRAFVLPQRAHPHLGRVQRVVDAGEQDPAETIAEIRAIREAAEAEARL